MLKNNEISKGPQTGTTGLGERPKGHKGLGNGKEVC